MILPYRYQNRHDNDNQLVLPWQPAHGTKRKLAYMWLASSRHFAIGLTGRRPTADTSRKKKLEFSNIGQKYILLLQIYLVYYFMALLTMAAGFQRDYFFLFQLHHRPCSF